MASLLALSLLVAPCLANLPSGATQVNDPEHIALLNTAHKKTWTAAPHKFFEGLTFDAAKRYLGAALSTNTSALNASSTGQGASAAGASAVVSDQIIPGKFDARSKWHKLIQPIRAQQRCASCWALSAADVLSDRTSIAQGKRSSALSFEDMARCSEYSDICQGRDLSAAWEHLISTGAATESCVPSNIRDGKPPHCPTECLGSERLQRIRAAASYTISGAVNMQEDIMVHGPIQAAFAVYKSFMVYKSGIYQKHWWEAEPEGGHAVRVLGWGTHKKHAYWLAANSWGAAWGEKGYFRIFRGESSCGIEELGPPQAGIPAPKAEDFMV